MQETPVWSLGWGDPWKRKRQPTPVFLPGKFHGQRRLTGNVAHQGYSPWCHKESDSTEHAHTQWEPPSSEKFQVISGSLQPLKHSIHSKMATWPSWEQGHHLFSSPQSSHILKHHMNCLTFVNCSQNTAFKWMITCYCSFVILASLEMKMMRSILTVVFWKYPPRDLGHDLTPMSSGTLCINKISQVSSSQEAWPHFQSDLRKQEAYSGIWNWHHRTECGSFSFVNEKQHEEADRQQADCLLKRRQMILNNWPTERPQGDLNA